MPIWDQRHQLLIGLVFVLPSKRYIHRLDFVFLQRNFINDAIFKMKLYECQYKINLNNIDLNMYLPIKEPRLIDTVLYSFIFLLKINLNI